MRKLFALLLLFACAPCFAAITVVQTHSTASYSATTASDSFATLPATGHAVIVAVNIRTAFNTFTATVADNQTGNTYTQVVSAPSFGGSASQTIFFWCPSITAPSGTFTVTATFTLASGSGMSAAAVVGLLEANGLSGTVDKTGTANGMSVMTGTVTASGANTSAADLVVASAALGSSYNMPTGMSNPATMSGGTPTTWYFQDGTSPFGDGVQGTYVIVSAIQTSAATWSWTSISDTWSGAVASFPGTPTTGVLTSGGHPLTSSGHPLVN